MESQSDPETNLFSETTTVLHSHHSLNWQILFQVFAEGKGTNMEEILTVQEVAKYLRTSRSTIWRWCSEGKLPAFKVGRSWRIRRAIVENLVDEQTTDEKLSHPNLTENANESL